MDMINSKNALDELINKNEMVLIYFGNEDCGVCNVLRPKIEELLKEYPKIKSASVDVEKSIEVSAAYNIFTIPAVLFYIQGKETIREARYISIQDIKDKIERYYNMILNNIV